MDAKITDYTDLILCSHVLYYIDRTEWMRHIEKLATWLSRVGVLVVIVQNHDTDCMRMLEDFFGYRFDLAQLADQFEQEYGSNYQVNIDTVPSTVKTEDINNAYVVAEFMLNLLPISDPPPRSVLTDYICLHFSDPGGGFSFSCDQDFLTISFTKP